MSAMPTEVFRAIDVPEDKASSAKLTAEIAAVNAKLVKLDGDVGLLKWMVGFDLAMMVTLLFRCFTH